MTEDIGSDAAKRPQEVEIAIMKERVREAAKRDATIMVQLDIILSKISKVETGILIGERRFDAIEEKHSETTDSLRMVIGRVDAIEASGSAITNKVLGGVGVLGFLAAAAAWIKDFIK